MSIMIPKKSISGFISRSGKAIARTAKAAILARTATMTAMAALLCPANETMAQGKLFAIQKDSVALFQGLQVSVDIAGPIARAVSDYGEYEAALKANLHNQYFPVVEIGLGSAKHDDIVTGNYYKTSAPFFRIGCDINLAKQKHTPNFVYAGLRYAFTSYKVDMWRKPSPDPIWGNDATFIVDGETCNQHWAEIVIGLKAKLFGPVHAGWNVRYKRRLSHKDCSAGNTWYIPGYGKYGDTRIGANFNVIIDI